MEGGPCPLFVSASVLGSPARSFSRRPVPLPLGPACASLATAPPPALAGALAAAAGRNSGRSCETTGASEARCEVRGTSCFLHWGACYRGRLWLALWGSRLSRRVLLRFVLAPRGPAPPFRFRRSVLRSVRRSVPSWPTPAECLAYPVAPPASPTKPFSVDRTLGPMMARNEVYLRFNYTWSRYNTNDKDDPRSRTTLPSRSVRRKRMCLRVTGPVRAMCPSSEPVSTMVPTPLFSVILERMSSPRLSLLPS